MNEELKSYINQELRNGLSKENIILKLKTEGGWNSEDIQPILNSLNKPINNFYDKFVILFLIINVFLGVIIFGFLIIK
jgi:hypothetical protein